MSLDAIKWCKLASSTVPATSTSNPETTDDPAPKKIQTHNKETPNPSRRASVEAIADDDDMSDSHRNARRPKNPRFIIESANDEEPTHPMPKKTPTHKKKTPNHAEKKAESCERENPNEESDDEELSETCTPTCDKLIQKLFRMSAKGLVIKGVCLFLPRHQHHIY
jgi:hypothetical protein